MAEEHKPVDLTLDKTARELRIEWAEGRKSIYGFDYLAALCPCANCREKRLEKERNPLYVLAGSSGPAELDQAEMMGRYALHLTWKEGAPAEFIRSTTCTPSVPPWRESRSMPRRRRRMRGPLHRQEAISEGRSPVVALLYFWDGHGSPLLPFVLLPSAAQSVR